jgi:zinc D-Ala-D-Ala carboxypeptidase
MRWRHTVLGPLAALLFTGAVLVAVTPAGRLPHAVERVAGRPLAILEEVPGPDTGPVCPLDGRYVDEQPRGLRPDVLRAWRRLRTEATRQGRELADAERQFGSAEQAARYVLPPEKSRHVRGIAVDVQPFASAGWVARAGRALGWCRRYENEYWHFEYDRRYAGGGCPPMLPSATGT